MSGIMRLTVVLVAAMALSATAVTTASAVTWHNTGDTAFTATGGAGTFTGTSGASLSCTGGSLTGTAPATVVGTTWAVSGTAQLSGCLLVGQMVGVDCGYTFTGSGQAGSVTNGDMDLTCGVYLAGLKICHLAGYLPSSYTNPTAPATYGGFGLHLANTMRSYNGSTNCPLGNGDSLTSSAKTFVVSTATGGPSSPHLGPRVTRTA